MLFDRAIASVLRQTYQNFELIVAVHGCTDDTWERVCELAENDSRIAPLGVDRIRRYDPTVENHWLVGPVDPLNAGLKFCIGTWIARLDDDDIWCDHHLDDLLTYARRGNFEFVSSAHETPAGVVQPYVLSDETRIGGCQTWLYRSYLRFFRYNRYSYLKSWNKNNDTDITDRMWRSGVRFGYLDKVTTIIYPRPGGDKIGLARYQEDSHYVESKYSF